MQAAVGCAQLEKFPSFVEKRRKNFDMLYEGLKDLEDKFILPSAAENSKPSWFGFLITVRNGFLRNDIVRFVEDAGVQTRMLFSGNLISHPCFDEMRESGEGYRVVGSLENTDRIMRDTFWIGVYPGMDEARINRMIKVLHDAVEMDERKEL